MRAQPHIMDERCTHPQRYFHFGRKILVPVTLSPKEKTPQCCCSSLWSRSVNDTFGIRAAFWFLQVFLRYPFTLLIHHSSSLDVDHSDLQAHTRETRSSAPCNDCTQLSLALFPKTVVKNDPQGLGSQRSLPRANRTSTRCLGLNAAPANCSVL